jgi:hypothetical protein
VKLFASMPIMNCVPANFSDGLIHDILAESQTPSGTWFFASHNRLAAFLGRASPGEIDFFSFQMIRNVTQADSDPIERFRLAQLSVAADGTRPRDFRNRKRNSWRWPQDLRIHLTLPFPSDSAHCLTRSVQRSRVCNSIGEIRKMGGWFDGNASKMEWFICGHSKRSIERINVHFLAFQELYVIGVVDLLVGFSESLGLS